MRKLVAVFVLLSFALPVQAGMVRKYDPVEQELLQNQKLEQDMNREYKNPAESDKPITAEKTEEPVKSNFWKWALGIALVGGAAVAAGGHSGGGSSSSGGGSTGNGTITW
jgi:hypothetical protein